MQILLVLFLPLIVAPALLYLFMTLGDAVVTAAVDWMERHDD